MPVQGQRETSPTRPDVAASYLGGRCAAETRTAWSGLWRTLGEDGGATQILPCRYGVGLFASRDCLAGEVLFAERPVGCVAFVGERGKCCESAVRTPPLALRF